ncbi:ATP-binding cassette domain-containing protein [Chitinibacter tainanensis]|uniref:ATP-binding cassette domain-containing protein n=1 Tax=Chitinibacter tainanensis TaxID=230667 RepID=UPI0003F9F266|nr:ATP-binding cassette domain-containing protein [Chitinibacter tainanensis]
MSWKHTITLNVAFAMSVMRTERVRQVAEMFGVGLDDKQFTIYDNLQFEIEQGDVFYITGESGSGKSIALRETARQLATAGLKVGSIGLASDGVLSQLFDPNLPLVDQLAPNGDMQEAIRLLSLGGINDANLVIRRPGELSDGQKYRLLLAYMLSSDADVWVADEFGAVLDRNTAKAISYQLQQAARRAGKTLIVATTHGDLVEDLNPSLILEKYYGEKVEIVRNDAETRSERAGE